MKVVETQNISNVWNLSTR